MSQSLRIAVADDEPDILDHYRKVLTRAGHEVVVAARNGRELIDRCRDVRPDLVLTDICMPDMDGIEAAAEIYADAPVPIILASSHHSDELIGQAEGSQILAYLVKPVRAADLSTTIAIVLRRFAQLRAMESLSLTDELTGLHNRRGFLTLAEQQVRLARRRGQTLWLLYIDLDGLKQVNDTQGHQAGDQLLQATAEVLRQTFRESDVLARLGGDEFGVLGTDDAGGAAAAGLRRLQENLEAYNAGKGAHSAALSLSVGAVEVGPPADVRIPEYLARADERMYEHKQGKREFKSSHRPFESSPIVYWPSRMFDE